MPPITVANRRYTNNRWPPWFAPVVTWEGSANGKFRPVVNTSSDRVVRLQCEALARCSNSDRHISQS